MDDMNVEYCGMMWVKTAHVRLPLLSIKELEEAQDEDFEVKVMYSRSWFAAKTEVRPPPDIF